MLQQTTVTAVLPFYERFLARLPDVASLARATEEEVLALWSGLGYYRRARSLRQGSVAVMKDHGGRVPADVETLMRLPGVGRYTAGAIASAAFGRRAAVVDGNVKRVLARLGALRLRAAALERRCWTIADRLVPERGAGEWNQALMELGATVCTPRAPRCTACPLRDRCRARALGKPTSFPAREARPAARRIEVAAAWIERRGRLLLAARTPDTPFRGSWDLPSALIPAGERADGTIARALRRRHGLKLAGLSVVATSSHTILATRLSIDVVGATAVAAPRSRSLRWVPLTALSELPVSAATTKIARAVRGTAAPLP
jgi:A/G-specific adenine glycosylase